MTASSLARAPAPAEVEALKREGSTMMMLAMAAVLAGAQPAPDQGARAQVEQACLRALAFDFADAQPGAARFYDKAWTRGRDGWRLDYEAEVTDRAGRSTGVTGSCAPAPAQEVAARADGR